MAPIKIGDYLFKRLRELGIRSVFGVPGDYELALLDLVEDNDLAWKGNPNELVASYAADGYARVNGAAAFVTTFGPGELSAYCGMAGHYAELVPVVHIVGYPTVNAVRSKAIMHHSLGTGKFDMYEQMAKHIMAATTVIDDVPTAASEIDRVLNAMMLESRPVYIGLSTDIAYETTSDGPLASPIRRALPPNEPDLEQKVILEIRKLLEKAKEPIIILDGGAVRSDVLPKTHELIKATGLPTFTTAMGKGGLNEDLAEYGGVHQGAGTHPQVKTAIERTDFVLWVGNFPSDFNTGEFTTIVPKSATIVDFQRFYVQIGEVKHHVSMKSDFLWPALGPFFRPGDVVIGETGTSAFGLCDSRIPEGVMMFNQTVYGSIGYATGAIVGVGQAIKESGGKWKRPILVTGEGSMHLTIQAIADMLRFDLKPIIFVLNNNGYTVERLIHGKTALYNEVAILDYSLLAKAFGPAFPSKYHGPIKTCGELTDLVNDPELGDANCFQLVELILPELDAPSAVIRTGAAIDEFNKSKFEKRTVPGA
ncbi:pyruvate decarboxylase [Lophiostoma macrostomum CBS 122681]|uniref:Pyruvate decarboxylase n=1 Tax=Lophiostoma macrostomum CBS 122681 TaxID=1314788 RepID=A0A6A6T3B9_9PLEO|nr:pyruvate decarboxylase [Lophiostoma macrostomum CBS 122681]